MKLLEVDALTKTFEEGLPALSDVSLALTEGEFFTVVGPTNAGKSTLLKTIAGLYRPTRGRVLIQGQDVTELEPRDRHVSLLFQNIALFPTLTGYENIAFPLRTAGVDDATVDSRVRDVADILKVGHILDRLPKTFSGGEQQRIAIGRAIAHRSRLLMLDEPLTNLDARIRIALRIEFKSIHRDTGQTLLYVTHDQVEAMSLSDRVAVLHEGRIQQIGTPDDVYHRPVNRFVSQFIGTPPMNILEGDLQGGNGGTRIVGEGFDVALRAPVVLDNAAKVPKSIAFGIRPEAIAASVAQSDETPVPGRVVWIERLGAKHVLDVELGGKLIKVAVHPDHLVAREGVAWFGFSPEPEHLLDLETGNFFT